MQRMLALSALFGAAMAYITGCGGGGTTGAGGTGGSTGGSGGSSTTGGTGGTGGSTTSSTGDNLLNGCDVATAEDHTADAETTIGVTGLKYTPPCIKIKAGNSVKFSATFATHPLVGGVVADNTLTPDAMTPIAKTSTGTEVTFKFPDAGKFGFYCDVHGLSGMMGAVFVQ